MNVQEVKQRFGLIGRSPGLDRAVVKAIQVANTDISVLVTGESGVGKESIPKIIHHLSHRKHAPYIAVNCGAIPEGTIDSELFGHEKGSFTGATSSRKGYFEEADGGTIFLDEVGELPLPTQVRLLRVLETGEFIRVGSSKIQKTDVRVVGATNVAMMEAIQRNKFREDLYYRLNTVEIHLPPLRERTEDIHLLFRKFAMDFSDKYHMPTVRLSPEAVKVLEEYRWPGNIRQLRNLVEQISVVEGDRELDAATLKEYIPDITASRLPMRLEDASGASGKGSDFSSEREILYKVLFDMRQDITNLKQLVSELIRKGDLGTVQADHPQLVREIIGGNNEDSFRDFGDSYVPVIEKPSEILRQEFEDTETVEDENLSLQDKEVELIKKALERNRGRRKDAAEELGISERTLYRKIKQYNLT
ncbi:MAG: sigma-54-dependent Fis family transcriptional regulator [Bacteroidetes bacterium]|uniref:Sigma-54-dependent Fis family transcriptional regulator n=1 Tax=Phaeocystidibacter marisrubri TaxID=1577780 RepID=A0A6L3ZG25_9FLAO|nr:sigma-54 dependent transcriptional regulator [Phaeocystidibacter marisrubri]KAB2816861.1 sigma-54-dependent Fis family transcriptional regulator [Phaeocystidibacter marisrubri]TNE29886.1 MAG: sigma-54-dependent Fis family transcriptional regulator [Bacteroidota bacterium]GGH77837.1 sigma-54-dependent Fis family transcriptional regulator [Phaeocystidibacter marisrubri]